MSREVLSIPIRKSEALKLAAALLDFIMDERMEENASLIRFEDNVGNMYVSFRSTVKEDYDSERYNQYIKINKD